VPYVVRKSDGSICALLKEPNDGVKEHLPANHPDITMFINAAGSENDVRLALQDSDAEIARVTEDLVHLLVKKNVILFTELPEMVQDKLISREKLRSKLNTPLPSIISDDDTI